jgi:hypothetical protein
MFFTWGAWIDSYAVELQANKVDTTDYGFVAIPAAWLGLMVIAFGVLSVAAGQLSGMTRPDKIGARLAVASLLTVGIGGFGLMLIAFAHGMNTDPVRVGDPSPGLLAAGIASVALPLLAAWLSASSGP